MKVTKGIYWISTILLCLSALYAGGGNVMDFFDGEGYFVDSSVHMGYPVYSLLILGIWQLLGVLALLVPGFPRIREWAYAGYMFLFTGAAASYLLMGEPSYLSGPVFPLLILFASYVTYRKLQKAGAMPAIAK